MNGRVAPVKACLPASSKGTHQGIAACMGDAHPDDPAPNSVPATILQAPPCNHLRLPFLTLPPLTLPTEDARRGASLGVEIIGPSTEPRATISNVEPEPCCCCCCYCRCGRRPRHGTRKRGTSSSSTSLTQCKSAYNVSPTTLDDFVGERLAAALESVLMKECAGPQSSTAAQATAESNGQSTTQSTVAAPLRFTSDDQTVSDAVREAEAMTRASPHLVVPVDSLHANSSKIPHSTVRVTGRMRSPFTDGMRSVSRTRPGRMVVRAMTRSSSSITGSRSVPGASDSNSGPPVQFSVHA